MCLIGWVACSAQLSALKWGLFATRMRKTVSSGGWPAPRERKRTPSRNKMQDNLVYFGRESGLKQNKHIHFNDEKAHSNEVRVNCVPWEVCSVFFTVRLSEGSQEKAEWGVKSGCKGCTCRRRIKMQLGEEERVRGRGFNRGRGREERSVLGLMRPVPASD